MGWNLQHTCLEQLLELPIEVISPSSEIIMKASEIKAEYAISYADCFAVATALKLSVDYYRRPRI
ncbi:MAG: PIN domain-containing protein [Deltaproteobacteria bacterium]|nr:PIN domain-containing protein [Deltaproteobacteria bacterium]